MYISVYNLFYTSLPVLAIGVLDQDVNDRNSILYPRLYTPGLQNLLFNKREFLRSALMGFFASAILFLIPYGKVFVAVTRIQKYLRMLAHWSHAVKTLKNFFRFIFLASSRTFSFFHRTSVAAII